jgi:hypothetical protein
MTLNINEYYGVTVIHAKKMGPRLWRARAQIFRRDTFAVVEEFFTEGGAMSSADTRAINEAERRVGFLDIPTNWKSR